VRENKYNYYVVIIIVIIYKRVDNLYVLFVRSFSVLFFTNVRRNVGAIHIHRSEVNQTARVSRHLIKRTRVEKSP